jgi:hypothetical protein
MAAAESPAYAFNSEITVGMSAPPMGTIISTPKTSRDGDDQRKQAEYGRESATSTTASATDTANRERLTMFCPL